MRAIKALQTSDKYKVAMPANWPDNELIGNKALNSAPKTVKDSKSRLKEFKGYAWWLTYRDLPAENIKEKKKAKR